LLISAAEVGFSPYSVAFMHLLCDDQSTNLLVYMSATCPSSAFAYFLDVHYIQTILGRILVNP
jgi:hypothetical protein